MQDLFDLTGKVAIVTGASRGLGQYFGRALARAGADLVSLCERIDSTSPMGKMVFRVLSALNEFEKDQLSERTRNVMAHLRQQNRRISSKIPLGYDLGKGDGGWGLSSSRRSGARARGS